jgi:ferredoxin-NADP reductase
MTPIETAWAGERPLAIESKTVECRSVASLVLVPPRPGPLPPFRPGQFITLVLDVPGAARVVRCYSLSNRPDGRAYRITVKAVGPASRHLVEVARAGDLVAARAPSGTFTLPAGHGPVVLIGAGIGVTPFVSIVESLASERSDRAAFVFLGMRSSDEHPFKERLAALALASRSVRLHVSYSRPGPGDVAGRDFQRAGRFSVDVLRDELPPADEPYDFFLCGPPGMLDDVAPGLEALGVPRSKIHVELFGAPSAARLTTRRFGKATVAPVAVRFAKSGREGAWTPRAGSLLDLALKSGAPIPFACAAGRCGTCATRLLAGRVSYPVEASFEASLPPGWCLPCVAVPDGPITLDA